MGLAVLLAIIAVLLAMAGALIFLRQGAPAAPPATDNEAADNLPAAEPPPPPPPPATVVIGENAESPMLKIDTSPARAGPVKAKALEMRDPTIARLGALVRAATPPAPDEPARTMELLIDGALLRPSDGMGLRAFAIEHAVAGAELAETPVVRELHDGIDGMDAWYLAAVLIAQKHLADINEKLSDIKEGVMRVSRFLDYQRKSQIQASIDYLEQACVAIRAGDLPEELRSLMEGNERDVLEVLGYLGKDRRETAEKLVENKDMLGTELLATGITQKIEQLENLFQGMLLCVKIRTMLWHVLSLYPGERQGRDASRNSIQQAITAFSSVQAHGAKIIVGEIANVKSMFDSESKLNERRRGLSKIHQTAELAIEQKIAGAATQLKQSAELIATHDRPLRLLFEFSGETVAGARELLA